MAKSRKLSGFQQLVFRLENYVEILLKSRFLNARLVFLMRRVNMEVFKKLIEFI